MFPASTWGKSFAIARSQQRTNESDVIRVLAQRPGTTVTFTPAPVSGTCGTLAAGQFCEVKVAGDTAIVATEPVLVGQYLQSSIWSNNANTMSVGNGDPSLAIAVPTEQFRKDYTILIPGAYDQSYISVATGMTGGVSVDGAPLTVSAFPGGAPYRGARLCQWRRASTPSRARTAVASWCTGTRRAACRTCSPAASTSSRSSSSSAPSGRDHPS